MGCSSDYQCKCCHSLEFNPILDKHSEIGGVADETVLKKCTGFSHWKDIQGWYDTYCMSKSLLAIENI